MTGEKTYFGVGLVVGIFAAALFLHYFAPRYSIVKAEDGLIKHDSWSGRSWRFVDKEWKKMASVDRDWGAIDHAIGEALHVPTGGASRANALSLLKKRYPILKDVADDELLERIKVVYSKEILCNLYLTNLLKVEGDLNNSEKQEKIGGTERTP